MPVLYRTDYIPTTEEFISILSRSTLGDRRPVDDTSRIEGMLRNASLICTAFDEAKLIGVARSMTDFVYCCYLSDLAVDVAYQKQGIGTRLISLTQSRLHPKAKIVLLAAPAARQFYPKIGMVHHDSAWFVESSTTLQQLTKYPI